MALQEQTGTIEAIKDTVQRWLDGKVSKAEFQAFLETSNAKLDQLAVEKERRAWEDLNWRTMY